MSTDQSAAVDPQAVLRVATTLGVHAEGQARWAHLPGDGVGPWKPPRAKRWRAAVVGLIKPIVLISFLGGALFFGSKALPSVFGGFDIGPGQVVPSKPTPAATPKGRP